MLEIKYKPNFLYSLELLIKFKILKPIEFLIYKNNKYGITTWLINLIFKISQSKRYFVSVNEIDEFSSIFKNKFKNLSNSKGKILFFSFNGANSYHTLRNLLLSYFYQIKGFDVEWYVCKEGLSICQKDRIFRERGRYKYFCEECFYGYDILKEATGLKIYYLEKRHQINEEIKNKINKIKTLNECINFNYNNIPVGELCKISVLYFLTQPRFFENEYEISTYKKYLLASIDFLGLLKSINFNNEKYIFTNNGTFFYDQLINFLSKENNIDFITQEIYDYPNSWIYEKNKIAVYAEKLNEWNKFKKDFYLNNEIKSKIIQELQIRRKYSNDENFLKSFKNKINVGLFPNFVWDSTVLDRNLYFDSLFDWIIETIKFFSEELKNVNLIIRDHPAPNIYKSQKSVLEIKSLVKPYLSNQNIFYLPPESKITSYDVMNVIQLGLVYNSTIGLEIMHQNIPVIISGKVHYREALSSAIKVSCKSEYFEMIKKIVFENDRKPISQDEILSYYYFWQNFIIVKFYGFRENYFAKRIEIFENNFENLVKNNLELFENFLEKIKRD